MHPMSTLRSSPGICLIAGLLVSLTPSAGAGGEKQGRTAIERGLSLWSMVNSPALYLATMAQAVPAQDAVTAAELKQIAGHLLRHQEADGSWAGSSSPAKNRPPPFFESDEVATLLAYMALGP